MKPLFDLLHDNFKFYWKGELFQQIKSSITKDDTLSLTHTYHPVFVTVISSLHGIGCVLFQKKDKEKLDGISYYCRNFTINEKKLCTTYRELIGVIYSLRMYESNIIGSDLFTNALNDHKPISVVLERKENFLYYFTLRKCNQLNSKKIVLFVQKEKLSL